MLPTASILLGSVLYMPVACMGSLKGFGGTGLCSAIHSYLMLAPVSGFKEGWRNLWKTKMGGYSVWGHTGCASPPCHITQWALAHHPTVALNSSHAQASNCPPNLAVTLSPLDHPSPAWMF